MGQKVSPIGLRLGVIRDWDSKWYANKKDFSKFILEDNKIRTFIKKKYFSYGIAKVTIERSSKGKNPFTVFRAYETDTGMDLPELTAENCGQTLLGVERSVFTRSGFLCFLFDAGQ